jgi:hypothetical protein
MSPKDGRTRNTAADAGAAAAGGGEQRAATPPGGHQHGHHIDDRLDRLVAEHSKAYSIDKWLQPRRCGSAVACAHAARCGRRLECAQGACVRATSAALPCGVWTPPWRLQHAHCWWCTPDLCGLCHHPSAARPPLCGPTHAHTHSMVEVQLAKLKEETRCPICFGEQPGGRGLVRVCCCAPSTRMLLARAWHDDRVHHAIASPLSRFPHASCARRQDPRRAHQHGVPAPLLRALHRAVPARQGARQVRACVGAAARACSVGAGSLASAMRPWAPCHPTPQPPPRTHRYPGARLCAHRHGDDKECPVCRAHLHSRRATKPVSAGRR